MQMAGDAGLQPVSQQARWWLAACLVPIGSALLLRQAGPLFAYEVEVINRPLVMMAASYCTASLLYLLVLWWLLPRHAGPRSSSSPATPIACLTIVIIGGLAARVLLFGSVPVQENDFYRYLWDGAVTASGLNPWQHAPQTVIDGASGPVLAALGERAGDVLTRVNYADLRTVYPPVTQIAFAVAHWLQPFSLDAWRAVLLVLELGMLGVIVALLRLCGRPALWCAVYWWNPIAIKEVMNSGHMEPVVMLPVVLALLLAIRFRIVAASLLTAIAAGAKLWPVLLLPAVWRRSVHRPGLVIGTGVAFAAASALMYWPVLAAGVDETSGFVAFGTQWQRISASFSALLWLSAQLPQTLASPELVARLAAAGLVGVIVLYSNRTAPADAAGLARRFMIAAAALLLLSPVQLPWYYLWLLPFLCIHPNPALLLISATFPVYYAFFELTARNVGEAWLEALVWAMWLPVWAALLAQWWPRAQTAEPVSRQEAG
jgi:alpha-1,6-mannosyltransferase